MECLLQEFNKVFTKISNNKPSGYINGFVPLLISYKARDPLTKLFIKYIHYDAVKSCNILLQPVIEGLHWTLLVGMLKENKWKFYNSLPNPMHKSIHPKIITAFYKDTKGAFDSDITRWSLYLIKGVLTKINNIDCRMFVCKYMEKIIFEGNTNWTECKNRQEEILKYMAEFAYALFCSSLK
ncbi:hypothetical protein IEQ34_006891 [Dendrobium chrysotoxum]|uniref:Ubiquitin-like protease family profile domain-containing protein n=1 Tax=Dendrobium chrysotoxum TaxID=161865 RepID=A0AAV7H9F1_DENCH|nr:hypothetical protein IEQ34_006891 [Dendrobium chrysotoxum]